MVVASPALRVREAGTGRGVVDLEDFGCMPSHLDCCCWLLNVLQCGKNLLRGALGGQLRAALRRFSTQSFES